MPRKSAIEERDIGEYIITARLDGMTQAEIAEKFDLNEGQVQRYLAKVDETRLTQRKSARRDALILEINQENAISELAKQLNEYSVNYNDAMNRGDEKAAYGWSRNRLDILEKMLRVSGLYDKARRQAEREIDEVQISIVDTAEFEELISDLGRLMEKHPEISADLKEILRKSNK